MIGRGAYRFAHRTNILVKMVNNAKKVVIYQKYLFLRIIKKFALLALKDKSIE